MYADGSRDTFSTDIIPWAQTADATVNPGVSSKCEYYLELVEEASTLRELHTRLVGDRYCTVYPNSAEKSKANRLSDRYALIVIHLLLNVCTK